VKKVYAVLVIALVLLTFLPLNLLLVSTASTTAGYAPNVLKLAPIALQPVLRLPEALPYASFISPTAFVASNYYVSTATGPISTGVLFDGVTVLASVPTGVYLNLSQVIGLNGNYATSLGRGDLYYVILLPNSTVPALAKLLPAPLRQAPGLTGLYNVFYDINPMTAVYYIGGTYWQNPHWTTYSTWIGPEYNSQGGAFFQATPTVLAQPSGYWFMAFSAPNLLYYSYANFTEPYAVPINSTTFGLGATSVPQVSSLTTPAYYADYSIEGPQVTMDYDTYDYAILTEVVLKVVGSSANVYGGLSFYPVPVSTPFVTQYFLTTGLNASLNPGIGTAKLPFSVNGTVIKGTLTNGPMRPTVIVAPLATVPGSTGWELPWYQVAYFTPTDVNSTAELYPLAVEQSGYNSYLMLVGGIGVTNLYILQVQVVPGAWNATYDVPSVSLSLVKEINFAGYGAPTSAVVNGYYALVGTSYGNIVLVNLLSGKVVNYVNVANEPLFAYTNLQAQPNPVPVAPFFTANATESLVESAFQAWDTVWTEGYEAHQGATEPGLSAQIGQLWSAIKYLYGGQHLIVLADFNLNTLTLQAPGFTVPFVNDVEGTEDPEYLYINGTVYQVVETGAINLWNRPVAGVSATGSLRASLSTSSPTAVPLPLTSNYAYVVDGVTVAVDKLSVLPGQVAHLVLYPWLQEGQIAYALNYGLVSSNVLYTKYATVSDLATTSITYPSFYTQYLAKELYDVGLSNVSTHFIVTMADAQLHPPPYFYTASAWVGTSIEIPANAPVPLYSNLEATAGFQAYTDVVPMVNNNPQGIFATAFKQGAGPAFTASALGYVANGIISAYMVSTTDATATSAGLIATAGVLSGFAETTAYVGIAMVVWAGVDYALAKWGGFGNAYVQNWVVMAPEFYDTANGKLYTAVELVLPAEEANNVPHYEEVLGTFFNESGFSGYYFQVVYPFYSWSQLNASIATGAYQPEVNLTQLAQGVASQYGIPLNDLVLTGVRLMIITRIHAKETFWQYVSGPVDFLVATVVGTTYLDIEGTTNAITYTNPAQIAEVLQYASVDNFTAPFQVENGQAVASVAIPPNDRLVIQLGGAPSAYADATIELHGYLIAPLYNSSTGIWYGNLTYGQFLPLQLGSTVLADGLPVPVFAGNVSLDNNTEPVTDLTGTQYQGLYYYTGHVIPLGTITSGQTLAFTFYANRSYLRPYAVPLANITGSDLPMFYGFLVSNPLNATINATLIAQVQGAPFNETAKELQLQKVTVPVPPGTYLVYVPFSELASYASSKGAYINLTLTLSSAPRYNATATEVWAPSLGLGSIAESPKPLTGITVYVYNALNGTVIGTGTAKPGADTLSVVNGTVYANATGSGSLVQGLVYAGAYKANWHVYNMTLGVFYNSTAIYLPAVPSTLKATVPWGIYPLANSSATYYWLAVWITYSDGAPANATVYVYNGTKLIRQVNTYGVAYLALPKGSYLVSAKVYYPNNASKGSQTLSNLSVSLTSNTLVRLSTANWELPFYGNVLAIVGVSGPSTAVAGYGYTLPLRLYAYVLAVPTSNVTYSSALGTGAVTYSLSNGTSVLPLNVPLKPANGTYVFTLKFTNYQNSTAINTTYTVAYYKVALRELIYLYGLIYWHVVSQAHPPYLLPGDTVAVEVAYYGPALSVPVNIYLNVISPDLSHWPQLASRALESYAKGFTITANSTYWVNTTLTVPFAPYLAVTASYNSSNPYVVPWFSNLTIPVDPVANVSLVTVFGSLISGKAVPVTLKVMSNVLPSQSHFAFVNIYDNTTNKYVLTALIQLSPVLYVTKYVTFQNSRILGIIPEPAEYHTLTLVLTGVSIPYESALRVLVVSNSFLIFFLIFLAFLILIVIAVNAVSGATRAIYNISHRFVRRVEAEGSRRFVREVRERQGWGHYVRRVEGEEDKDRKHYVRKG
jgi:hypothetical protein